MERILERILIVVLSVGFIVLLFETLFHTHTITYEHKVFIPDTIPSQLKQDSIKSIKLIEMP